MQDPTKKEAFADIDLTNNIKTEKEGDIKSTISNDSTGIFYQKTNTSKEQINVENEEKVLYKFDWKDNNTNKQVLLTGDFVNWKKYYDLNKENDGTFSLSIKVPKKLIQFKFFVDGEWKISLNYSTYKNNEWNMNNYIDLTNNEHNNNLNKNQISQYKAKNEAKENKNLKNGTSDNKENITNSNICPNSSESSNANVVINSNTYSSIYPKKNEMKSKAGHVPFHYSFPINLNYNSNQNRIGNKKYLNYHLSSQTNEENSSYREIFEAPHININHILTNNKSNNYIQLCLSQRNRKKVTTLVYYKPV